jgi:hypothetical protein
MHFLYSVYYELTFSACFEHYLLIFRRRCVNNNWYRIACVLCLLAATRVGVGSTPTLVAANRQYARSVPIVVYAAPLEDEQVMLETYRGC